MIELLAIAKNHFGPSTPSKTDILNLAKTKYCVELLDWYEIQTIKCNCFGEIYCPRYITQRADSENKTGMAFFFPLFC
jgi:hypothetical protein